MNGGLRLGVIADDYTGASDLGSRLYKQGASAGLVFGLPDRQVIQQLSSRHDAVIVALKSRSVAPGDAVRMAVEALDRLSSVAPAQVLFKYCSTFDSTARGNIGPVIDALLEARGLDCTIAVPALPANGRTQYLGHLFVNGVLLDESPMRHHPLNPMTDANLVRHLASQTPRRVGLIVLDVVRAGAPAIRAALERARSDGDGIMLVDAIADEDLLAVGEACRDMALVTGGSGLAWGIVPAWARDGWRPAEHAATPSVKGVGVGGLIIAGSCSAATLSQLEALRIRGIPLLQIDLATVVSGGLDDLQAAARSVWDAARVARGWCAIAASAPVARRAAPRSASDDDGLAEVGGLIEQALAHCARDLVLRSPPAVVCVAGGETSGAVVDALGVRAVSIGPSIAPGVPWLREHGDRGLRLVLKSGNFGDRDFFLHVMQQADADACTAL